MSQDDQSPSVLPLAEETLNVSVRNAVTGRVRVSTSTETFEEVVRQELRGMSAEVERVPIDRTLDPGETPPVPRTEGDVTIIPVLEEIVVVEKRLVLKEELHITRSATVEEIEVPVELRRQRAIIERLAVAAEDPSNSGDENG
jgi:stress response protein YsnF